MLVENASFHEIRDSPWTSKNLVICEDFQTLSYILMQTLSFAIW